MKQALEQAINADVGFRGGLPLDIWHNFGYSYAQFGKTNRRQQITTHLKSLFRRIENHLDVDDAVDKMAMKFQHDALPPVNGLFKSLFCCKPKMQFISTEIYDLFSIRYCRRLKKRIRPLERCQTLREMVRLKCQR